MSKFYANLRKVDKGILRSICQRGGNKKGSHDNDNETVPQQCSGSGNSIEMPVQTEKWWERVMQGWWGAPDYRVPTWWWQGKRGQRAPTNRARCKHEHLIHHTCIRSRRSSRGYTFEACVIEAVRVKRCSRSRSSWEVVVLGDGSRSRS